MGITRTTQQSQWVSTHRSATGHLPATIVRIIVAACRNSRPVLPHQVCLEPQPPSPSSLNLLDQPLDARDKGTDGTAPAGEIPAPRSTSTGTTHPGAPGFGPQAPSQARLPAA